MIECVEKELKTSLDIIASFPNRHEFKLLERYRSQRTIR